MNYVYNIKADVLHPFDLLFTVMGVNVLNGEKATFHPFNHH